MLYPPSKRFIWAGGSLEQGGNFWRLRPRLQTWKGFYKTGSEHAHRNPGATFFPTKGTNTLSRPEITVFRQSFFPSRPWSSCPESAVVNPRPPTEIWPSGTALQMVSGRRCSVAKCQGPYDCNGFVLILAATSTNAVGGARVGGRWERAFRFEDGPPPLIRFHAPAEFPGCLMVNFGPRGALYLRRFVVQSTQSALPCQAFRLLRTATRRMAGLVRVTARKSTLTNPTGKSPTRRLTKFWRSSVRRTFGPSIQPCASFRKVPCPMKCLPALGFCGPRKGPIFTEREPDAGPSGFTKSRTRNPHWSPLLLARRRLAKASDPQRRELYAANEFGFQANAGLVIGCERLKNALGSKAATSENPSEYVRSAKPFRAWGSELVANRASNRAGGFLGRAL